LFEGLQPDLLFRLAADPVGTIESTFDLIVEVRDEIVDSPSTVAGHYFPDQRRIVVARALSRARTRFTALHELGHHLIKLHEALALELRGPPRQQALEEAVCDSFAGRILIPDELVEKVIPGTGPTASDVVELWRAAGTASRAASAVRAAEKLGAPGHVMVATRDSVVQFTATRGIDYVVAPGSLQHDGVVRRAGRIGHAQGDDHVTYRSGTASEEFHVDAVLSDDYVFAVFTKGPASWVRLHVLEEDRSGPEEAVCPDCDHAFEFWSKHVACKEPVCPACGRCGCHRRRIAQDNVCSKCFKIVAVHLLVSGVCDECR